MVNRSIRFALLASAALLAFPGDVQAQCTGQPPGNTVCAAPSGAAGLPKFRPLVSADMPAGSTIGAGVANNLAVYSGTNSISGNINLNMVGADLQLGQSGIQPGRFVFFNTAGGTLRIQPNSTSTGVVVFQVGTNAGTFAVTPTGAANPPTGNGAAWDSSGHLVDAGIAYGPGSVTTVSVGNLSPLFTSAVATPSSTPAVTFSPVNQAPNLFYAGPASGGSAAPGFRAVVSADVPAINLAAGGNGGVTGNLPNAQVAGLGTAATQNTGTSGATIPFNNGNNNLSGSNTVSGPVNFTSTFQVGGFTMTWPGNNATLPQLVARGTVALGTSAIGSGACAGAVAGTASAGNVANILTTDTISTSFNGDPSGILGYQPLTTGMLTIMPYPTAGAANFKVCNTTNASITPAAVTLNWIVVR